MKATPFLELHEQLGAKIVDFAGYRMPVSYAGIKEEHHNIRTNVGVFDVSHMGEFILKGEKAADLIQRITTNDVYKIEPGQAQYSCMMNNKGGIVDDLLVYHLEDNNYMLVVNGANLEKDWNWIQEQNTDNVEMHNISDNTALLAVQGPNAVLALQGLTDVNLEELKYYTFTKAKFAGVNNVIISATGYTGSGGFEIYFESQHAHQIWTKIFEEGAKTNIQPAGLGARDTLRLEMGFCLYGNDIDDTTSPLEAGLGWITKVNDTNNFIGKDFIVKQKEEGTQSKLAGFTMIDRGIPRGGYEIVNAEGQVIGRVTSGTQSPSLDKAIGLGYMKKEYAKVDNEIFIRVRNKDLKATVTKFPFYKAD